MGRDFFTALLHPVRQDGDDLHSIVFGDDLIEETSGGVNEVEPPVVGGLFDNPDNIPGRPGVVTRASGRFRADRMCDSVVAGAPEL